MRKVAYFDCSPDCLEYMGYDHHENCQPVYAIFCAQCGKEGCSGPPGYDYNCDGSPRRRDSLG